MSAALCAFDSVHSAASAAAMILQLGVPVAKCELLDATTIAAFNSYAPRVPDMPVAPHLFLEFHGLSDASVRHYGALLARLPPAHLLDRGVCPGRGAGVHRGRGMLRLGRPGILVRDIGGRAEGNLGGPARDLLRRPCAAAAQQPGCHHRRLRSHLEARRGHEGAVLPAALSAPSAMCAPPCAPHALRPHASRPARVHLRPRPTT